ncbi:S-adenosyl-L-methionine-dependent methyltransferase [Penicillium sp. IBT 18751x]|nr:S-adenosyl-L-methionine-dependent methyltransferase [Penicillium sp. IBT 18751x]
MDPCDSLKLGDFYQALITFSDTCLTRYLYLLKMNNTDVVLSDPTFRCYTSGQATRYAENRLSYPAKLYDLIIRYHAETDGQFMTLLDVGCGPGNATRDLAIHFECAVGIDPGLEMIQTGQYLGGVTKTNRPIQFQVATAEDCANIQNVEDGVDLLVSAMAAHWFSMAEFWVSAAKIVNPGGTVALWTCASLYCHPSTPHAAEVQNALFHLEQDILKPYELPPNRLSRDLYDNLVLPWHLNPPFTAFPFSEFRRLEWDRDGILSDGKDFFVRGKETSLQGLGDSLGTASMVTRWRAAHPEQAGTDKDCVNVTIAQVKKALGDNGCEDLKLGHSSVVLLFKKR